MFWFAWGIHWDVSWGDLRSYADGCIFNGKLMIYYHISQTHWEDTFWDTNWDQFPEINVGISTWYLQRGTFILSMISNQLWSLGILLSHIKKAIQSQRHRRSGRSCHSKRSIAGEVQECSGILRVWVVLLPFVSKRQVRNVAGAIHCVWNQSINMLINAFRRTFQDVCTILTQYVDLNKLDPWLCFQIKLGSRVEFVWICCFWLHAIMHDSKKSISFCQGKVIDLVFSFKSGSTKEEPTCYFGGFHGYSWGSFGDNHPKLKYHLNLDPSSISV